MRFKQRHPIRHRQVAAAKAAAATTWADESTLTTRSGFTVAAAAALVLNVAIVIFAPLWQWPPADASVPPLEVSGLATPGETSPRPAAGAAGVSVAPTAAASSTTAGNLAPTVVPSAAAAPRAQVLRPALQSAFQASAPSSLRLIPDARGEEAARANPRWLAFGISSVHRQNAEYLGFTLSHLFDVLDGDSTGAEDTAIIVHLADFDEGWVARTQQRLTSSFEDEVQAGRLHVIHAPERLYPGRAEVLERSKFGDPPDRQWWRAKQNLDYAFLMWYAANISTLYMQLEDDVQVVPGFLGKVRAFYDERLAKEQWIMASFSKLGFIGKMFNSSDLLGLAEFLLAFHGEAPCDWLVWVYIDILSPQPITAKIQDDLESEFQKVLAHQKDPSVKLPKALRDDVGLFYLDYHNKFFNSQALPVNLVKPSRLGAAQAEGSKVPLASPVERAFQVYPKGNMVTNMRTYSDHEIRRAYPPVPGESIGFWSADTCWRSRSCDKAEKFVKIIFNTVVFLNTVEIEMGNAAHEGDYMHNATLEAALYRDGYGCSKYTQLTPVSTPRVVWHGDKTLPTYCLQLRMLAAQEEWVMLRFKHIGQGDPPAEWAPPTIAGMLWPWFRVSSPTATSTPRPTRGQEAARNVLTAQVLLAVLVGVAAGVVSWAAVCAGWRCCSQGLQLMGEFTCWSMSFIVVFNVLALLMLTPPLLPAALLPSRAAPASEAPQTRGRRRLAAAGPPVAAPAPAPEMSTAPLDWQFVRPGAIGFDPDVLRVLPEGGAGGGAGGAGAKQFLVIGVLADGVAPNLVVGFISRIFDAGQGAVSVVVHANDRNDTSRGMLLAAARADLAAHLDDGSLHVIHAPEELYPAAAARRENVDYAALLLYGRRIGDYYLQVDLLSSLRPGAVGKLQRYLNQPKAQTWHAVSLDKEGFLRKVLRADLLPQMAELLLLFPDVPADVLFWDFLDIVGNQTAPKACALASLATKQRRKDVVLQYHNAKERLVEHVGDVSSLEGKVQRIHDEYFRKHPLADTLFDNPPATLHMTLGGNVASLPRVYGNAGLSRKENTFICSDVVNIAPPTEAAILLIFPQPTNIEIFLMRMGGFIRPVKKDQQGEIPDHDFQHVLDDAELEFGRDLNLSGLVVNGQAITCRTYESIEKISGRQVFWRSPRSRPAQNVSCIRVAIRRPQKAPMILRGIQVRSSHAHQARPNRTSTSHWIGESGRAQSRAISSAADAAKANPMPSSPRTAPMLRHGGDADVLDASRGKRFAAVGAQLPAPASTRLLTPTALEHWNELHMVWALTVSIAFGAGAVMGTLGCFASQLRCRGAGPRRQVRPRATHH